MRNKHTSLSAFESFLANCFSHIFINKTVGSRAFPTLEMRCISILRPSLPGYLPSILAGD